MCRTPSVNEAGTAGTLVESLSTGDRPHSREPTSQGLLHWHQHFPFDQVDDDLEPRHRYKSGGVLYHKVLCNQYEVV